MALSLRFSVVAMRMLTPVTMLVVAMRMLMPVSLRVVARGMDRSVRVHGHKRRLRSRSNASGEQARTR